MKHMLTNINAPTFTLSAIAIGYVLISDLGPAEQNTIGNWFLLIGQVLCTNAAQQQVINNNQNAQPNQNNQSTGNTQGIVNDFNIDTVKRSINIMNNEINKF